MSPLKCPECKSEINDTVERCPYCGIIIPGPDEIKYRDLIFQLKIGAIILIFFIINLMNKIDPECKFMPTIFQDIDLLGKLERYVK
jgi:hypothetical protein